MTDSIQDAYDEAARGATVLWMASPRAELRAHQDWMIAEDRAGDDLIDGVLRGHGHEAISLKSGGRVRFVAARQQPGWSADIVYSDGTEHLAELKPIIATSTWPDPIRFITIDETRRRGREEGDRADA